MVLGCESSLSCITRWSKTFRAQLLSSVDIYDQLAHSRFPAVADNGMGLVEDVSSGKMSTVGERRTTHDELEGEGDVKALDGGRLLRVRRLILR